MKKEKRDTRLEWCFQMICVVARRRRCHSSAQRYCVETLISGALYICYSVDASNVAIEHFLSRHQAYQHGQGRCKEKVGRA